MNKRPWRCSCCWNHGNDFRHCHNHATEVRIQHLRRLLKTVFRGYNATGYKGLGAMWHIEVVLQQGLSGRGLYSNDGAIHTDDDLWTVEVRSRFLDIFSFVLGMGIHLPTAL